ncbi:hypothetical protein Psfp_01733 [Pelotomaculum sp. FP]|uniref:hypothetical protein n=1 Tax=Pelotomaculum sp. FP TaxID=261474 RepID=UPI0011045995|nr:hypothetical protein [Pelotomaculum sp. FP]TEB15957.1 hypothetical protein Psfp_01733 [Pelotomaculum sp. FP]
MGRGPAKEQLLPEDVPYEDEARNPYAGPWQAAADFNFYTGIRAAKVLSTVAVPDGLLKQ